MGKANERVALSQGDRDALRVMAGVLDGTRTQAEAARLLRRSTRQIRRMTKRLRKEGDGGIMHRLRGRPSNRQWQAKQREKILATYRAKYSDFGPTLASEKLVAEGMVIGRETLRQWLLAAGLWAPRRRRERHRQRRPRRISFGELVQMDASHHDWLEGRGEKMALIAMIDDATSRIEARFCGGETLEGYFELVERWVRRHGRPVAVYTDRHSIFQYQSQGRAAEGDTQFGRALTELRITRILAHSPQAKGRIERFFGTAQDRWVKELRLAKVTTRSAANELVRRKLVPEYNRRFTVKASSEADAHRPMTMGCHLAAILCPHEERVVSNDYTVRYANRVFQVGKPALPGLRGGRVVVEERRDGTVAIRFGDRYLKHEEVAVGRKGTTATRGGGVAATPVGLRPPSVAATPPPRKKPYRPSDDHPWRRLSFGKPLSSKEDISIGAK